MVGQRGELLGDTVIASAVLDRLLHHSHVLNIRGELQPQGETPGGAIPVATPSRRFAGGGRRNDATGRGVVEWKMWRS